MPNGFSKIRSVPAVALEEIIKIVEKNIPDAEVLEPITEKTSIHILQQKGIVVYNKDIRPLNPYQRAQEKC